MRQNYSPPIRQDCCRHRRAGRHLAAEVFVRPGAGRGREPALSAGLCVGMRDSRLSDRRRRERGRRGASIWDVFSHTPGKTHNGDTGDVADDSYHRYKEDIALLKQPGRRRLSHVDLRWPRIFPEGKGSPTRRAWTTTSA